MHTLQSELVVIGLRLPPGSRDRWLHVWAEVRDRAFETPDCFRFHLLGHPVDETRCAVVSEWTSRADFDRFFRDTGLLWIERAAGSACSYDIWDTVPDELSTYVEIRDMKPVALV